MDALAQQAIEVLRGNDRGTWTRPSPRLYPHQWSWDAAFVAIGWAHLSPMRAVNELWSLLRGQWATGMIPQIVFDLNVAEGRYEPGPNAWGTTGHAPAGTATSAICQPPVHALALARVLEIARGRGDGSAEEVEDAIVDLYPRLVRWHRWLHDARDPDGTGLITIFHPWESGLDNSPRWDTALDAVEVPADAAEQDRPDLTHVADPSQRPTDGEYRRYRALLDALIAVDHDQDVAYRQHPFRMGDVWVTAILAAAEEALATLAVVAGRPRDAEGHRVDAARLRDGLERSWDPETERCDDLDRTTGERTGADTLAGFAPLVAGCSLDRSAKLVARLFGPSYAGAPGLAWPLPPSTAVDDPAFDPVAYWRGPQWPPMTWLLWHGLVRAGHRRSAEQLRTAALAQLRSVGCTEYVQPLTGEPLGSRAQSWTAAVALDLLAYDR